MVVLVVVVFVVVWLGFFFCKCFSPDVMENKNKNKTKQCASPLPRDDSGGGMTSF